jgi:hypothetical protein
MAALFTGVWLEMKGRKELKGSDIGFSDICFLFQFNDESQMNLLPARLRSLQWQQRADC